ncbi:heterokaryon incompatibility protein-domain-containing protein [Cladorrhinum sp. PSN332]|nr:heterokaryon incompatibility protein-domain-containing protein [Cladorrhinum sp. PSN332]
MSEPARKRRRLNDGSGAIAPLDNRSGIAAVLPSYQYRSLRGESHIRLLFLYPELDRDAPVRCRILSGYSLVSHGRCGTHLFETVSYVWGPPPNTHQIIVDGKYSLPVRENCYAMLCRLRDPNIARIIRIDSICINQEDNDEKTTQVQLMTMVYASAVRVNVWLEEPGGDEDRRQQSRMALNTISAAASRNDGAEAVRAHPGGWQAVGALLRRSWFRRIWVLQEVAAARNITIVCQYGELDGHAFCSGLEVLAALEVANKKKEKQLTPLSSNRATRSKTGALIAAGSDSSESRIRTSILLMKGASLRPRAATRASQSETFSLSIMPLYDLINLYRDRSATDPRDKRNVFYRIVRCFVGEGASITTWAKQEIAVIRTRFLVVGQIINVAATGGLTSRQNVEVELTSGWEPMAPSKNTSKKVMWSIQAPTNPLREGDIHKSREYLLIILINTIPIDIQTQSDVNTRLWQEVSKSRLWNPPLVETPLVWDWSILARVPQEQASCYSQLLGEIFQSPKCYKEKAHGWEHTARLMVQLKKFRQGIRLLRTLVQESEGLFGKNSPEMVGALVVSRNILSESGQKHWAQLLDLEANMIQLTMRRSWVSRRDWSAKTIQQGQIDLLVPFMECWGPELRVIACLWHGMAIGQASEALGWILYSVSQNQSYGRVRKPDIPYQVTCAYYGKAVAALNYYQDQIQTIDRGAVMKIIQSIKLVPARANQSLFAIASLLSSWESRVPRETKQEALEQVIKFHPSADTLLKVFLDSWGDWEFDPARLVMVAADSPRYGLVLISALLDRYGPRIAITEEMLQTVLDIDPVPKAMETMELLIRRKCNQIIVTEVMADIAWNKSSELGRLLCRHCARSADCAPEVVRVASGYDLAEGEEIETGLEEFIWAREHDIEMELQDYKCSWEWEIYELYRGNDYSSNLTSAFDLYDQEGMVGWMDDYECL